MAQNNPGEKVLLQPVVLSVTGLDPSANYRVLFDCSFTMKT